MGIAPNGMYNPAYEHDSCGVAMVVDIHGRRSRDIVDKAITALLNLEHRGAQGAEPNTGDGAGILLQVPDKFLRAVCEFDLPEPGSYATGIAFLPQSAKDAAAACAAVLAFPAAARALDPASEPTWTLSALIVAYALFPMAWRRVAAISAPLELLSAWTAFTMSRMAGSPTMRR